MHSLTKGEIIRIVNRYIGVQNGYLGSFSYRTHAEFYPEYCELEIDPSSFQGTTRDRFIAILESVTPDKQAQIIRGLLEKFPLDEQFAPPSRTAELRDELLQIVRRLEGASPILALEPIDTSMVVIRAIADAKILIETGDAVSAVDRLHTAFHGHLRHICARGHLQYDANANVTGLFKVLRTQHPGFQNSGPRAHDIERILNSLASIVDALNPIRNHASIAHPNDDLLGDNEAKLVVNVINTLFHYVETKVHVAEPVDEVKDDIPF